MADPTPNPIPMIERRRIEAEMLKEVYATLVQRHGADEAKRVVAESVRRSALAQAQRYADAAPGGTSLKSFIAIQSHWTAEDALRFEVTRSDATHYEFKVTRCRYAEMYREMGLGELGPLLSCNRDGSFCDGYDARLKLTRTQTLMEGASHCDFRYRYEDAPGQTG